VIGSPAEVTKRESRFSPDQIIGVLHEVEAGGAIQEICRRHGITETTFHRSRRKYGGLQASAAQRLRALEEENWRLERLVADQALDLQVVKDLLGTKW
jgi:putative transposase